jgi:hypothetical protein
MVLSKIDLAANTTSLESVRERNTPRISSLSKKQGEEIDISEPQQFIKIMLIFLTEFFGTSWTDSQIKQCANEIYLNFRHWSLLDCKLFTDRCKTLFYSEKLYGAFSPAILMEWCQKYDREWMETSENISFRKHDQIKKAVERCRDMDNRELLKKSEEFHNFEVKQYSKKMKKKSKK